MIQRFCYYSYSISRGGEFQYFLDKEKLSQKIAIEGTYIFLTSGPNIYAYDAILAYKRLLLRLRISFKKLKDSLGIRSNHHKTDERIKTYIFISHLTLALYCILKPSYKKKNSFICYRGNKDYRNN